MAWRTGTRRRSSVPWPRSMAQRLASPTRPRSFASSFWTPSRSGSTGGSGSVPTGRRASTGTRCPRAMCSSRRCSRCWRRRRPTRRDASHGGAGEAQGEAVGCGQPGACGVTRRPDGVSCLLQVDISDTLEAERQKVDAKTPITEAVFREWRRGKVEERRARLDKERAERLRAGRLTGKEIFESDGFVAEDDDAAGGGDDYQREIGAWGCGFASCTRHDRHRHQREWLLGHCRYSCLLAPSLATLGPSLTRRLGGGGAGGQGGGGTCVRRSAGRHILSGSGRPRS